MPLPVRTFHLCDNSHPNRCEVTSCCGFELDFSGDEWHWAFSWTSWPFEHFLWSDFNFSSLLTSVSWLNIWSTQKVSHVPLRRTCVLLLLDRTFCLCAGGLLALQHCSKTLFPHRVSVWMMCPCLGVGLLKSPINAVLLLISLLVLWVFALWVWVRPCRVRKCLQLSFLRQGLSTLSSYHNILCLVWSFLVQSPLWCQDSYPPFWRHCLLETAFSFSLLLLCASKARVSLFQAEYRWIFGGKNIYIYIHLPLSVSWLQNPFTFKNV